MRLAPTCATLADLGVMIAIDWALFFFRTVIFWRTTMPGRIERCIQNRPRLHAFSGGMLSVMFSVQTMDKVWNIPDLKLAEYRGYEYKIENIALR